MAGTTKGLGRGFESLIPQNFDASLLLDENERIQKVSTKDVYPNKDQPRKYFDTESLEELAGSIKRHGILQPLIVSPSAGGGYVLIAGERRLRAATIAGLDAVPVIVRTSQELEQLEISLIENVQRVDLDPLEQAVSIQRLHEQFNIGYSDIGKRLGKAETTINNIVRLLGLPEEARQALQKNKISEGHARAILSLKDRPEKQLELLDAIITQGWSVRQAEQFVTAHKSGAKTKQAVQRRIASTTPETERLSQLIAAPVNIKRMAKGGKLEIGFKGETELNKLIAKITRALKK